MKQPETQPNQAQSELWNARAGEVWVEQNAMLDRLLEPLVPPLLEAIEGAGAVLDIGCGAGATTLAAARSQPGRRCTGIDLSRPLVEAARRRAAQAGLDNASFLAADAQSHAFAPGGFDAMISRFGVMFFDDPVGAFANLRRAARPGARLAAVAWRGAAENPFMTTAERAAAPLLPDLAPRDPAAPGQFAFADPDKVRGILTDSGWREVDVQPLDVAAELPEADLDVYVTQMGPVGLLLSSLEEPKRSQVAAVVREAFGPYVSAGAARFTAACWLVRAHAG